MVGAVSQREPAPLHLGGRVLDAERQCVWQPKSATDRKSALALGVRLPIAHTESTPSRTSVRRTRGDQDLAALLPSPALQRLPRCWWWLCALRAFGRPLLIGHTPLAADPGPGSACTSPSAFC